MTTTSPIERLPYDCLSEMFAHACKSPFDAARSYLNWPHRIIALRLTGVCSHWRKALLSNTALWSTFEYIHEPPYTQASIDCLQLYLARSGNHVLSFTIHDHKDQDPDFIVPDSQQSEFMQIICAEAHRWKRANFNTKAPEFDASAGTFSMNAPALRSVEVQLHKAKKNNFSLPWGQITDLKLFPESSISRATHILPLCRNLRRLELWNHLVDFTGPIPAPTVVNGVESLVIAAMASPSVIPFFVFPDVVSLTINGAGRTISPGRELISFLSLPCAPQLQHPIFDDTCITDDFVLEILSLTPSLHTLEKYTYTYDEEAIPGPSFLRRLTLTSPSHSNLVPHLKTLKIRVSGPAQDLIDMLRSRLQGSARCLDSVTLEGGPRLAALGDEVSEMARDFYEFRTLDKVGRKSSVGFSLSKKVLTN
ncbi:uncharacterized protein EV420DRAFT_1485665 [Desarmillaria tabescens]|uniref:F-box domain-containing protein n=1 Tax=Armillaria tabescens TaxID=1929756 RepID=A0AA39JEC0_ARMTA|nr:uncharacterized protein EV420DRAFT_1485665 [Desarmillaria tabescens]KAK0441201.1 hypothetical protein EV420DRAFT_1485665 [Desarmillaria tabescens]